ncbi:membrane steroid-binding protein 1 [Dendrobium catenatum]|uniref:Membrane steroid-binding protein 2 n=1 Tax=Dendrobium catenatum TaxID=906689 RepID=A0A2I0XI40_9ASPA|nr:membrane steroid-binding protein 1 [Dendrobium catenatum]PKU87569.1 Membrane steroid-binding protein 2 [Dendrobium catenatum]
MEVKELWATLEHAIKSYTGLSAATFFTFVAVAVAFYYVVSAYFEPAPVARKREVEAEPVEPLPPPVQLGEITEEELIAYDGSDPKKPLLMAIKGQIYDVTQSRFVFFSLFFCLRLNSVDRSCFWFLCWEYTLRVGFMSWIEDICFIGSGAL